MTGLHAGDEDMRLSDGSHTWIAPAGEDPQEWARRVRLHLEAHRGRDEIELTDVSRARHRASP